MRIWPADLKILSQLHSPHYSALFFLSIHVFLGTMREEVTWVLKIIDIWRELACYTRKQMTFFLGNPDASQPVKRIGWRKSRERLWLRAVGEVRKKGAEILLKLPTYLISFATSSSSALRFCLQLRDVLRWMEIEGPLDYTMMNWIDCIGVHKMGSGMDVFRWRRTSTEYDIPYQNTYTSILQPCDVI